MYSCTPLLPVSRRHNCAASLTEKRTLSVAPGAELKVAPRLEGDQSLTPLAFSVVPPATAVKGELESMTPLKRWPLPEGTNRSCH
jgi:hypothetical protein